ncbi:HAD superfamily hydrolase (TIGR01509 family) [Aequitasia blattaphilus]|uniref:HAD family phosphatase n=1 Tax=Aequitasia blattaphilus TaxID=2949332 RepID=A0ABT1E685_9FIRM|nr:HAD family phosphatase [Aequitasia blattaphilus]MCP1101094.1 HAD family phosphatase [Aequitasia blattaphilus]MCR8613734.1 HAD family phosphatase [Aequitasia blattaphilus]
MLKDIEGIIFDLDGTLIDSMWIWPSVDEEYLGARNLRMPEGFQDQMEGMSYRDVAKLFRTTFPSIESSTEEIMEEWIRMAYHKYVNEVPLKSGVKKFLQEMRRREIPMGIATSNTLDLVLDTLKSLEIDFYFSSIHSANEVKSGKPEPDIYLLVSQELGISPKKCLVFEDVPMGILAGKNAGMKVCGVEDSFSANQVQKKKALADFYINHYDEIEMGTFEVCK